VIGALVALLLALPGDTGHAAGAVLKVPLDTAQVVNFRTAVSPETVYVGQQATYQLGVFIDESVRDRLRRMEALPPEMRGLMAYEPPASLTGFPMRAIGRRRYEAHVSLRAVFPLAAGRYAIAPARLVYAMPLSYSFFSREESFELRSDSTVIIAIDPPANGRPPDFMGAVGQLRIEARLDTAGARVGDPLHLTLRVSGTGNVKLFPRPALVVPWASAISADERVVLAPDSITVRGVKEFDWVLTPMSDGRHVLGAVRYSYFDPVARRYDVATSAPIALTVAPGALAAVDTGAASRRPVWDLRAAYRGELPIPLYRQLPFILLVALAPAPALALAFARRPKRERRRRRRVPPELRLRELARGPNADLRSLRRAWLDAVAARLRANASAVAEPETLRRAARRAGTSGATAGAAAAFVAELNTAAFSAHQRAVPGAGDRALKLYRAIDGESRRWRVPPHGVALVIVVALAAGTALALEPANDQELFAAGVDAYSQRHFADAAKDFRTLVQQAPRAADAWANFGTASFAAGDTAHAVVGWQRALRLEPLASDVRERLDLVAPAPASAPGAVPPVPPLDVIVVASLLWIASWGALFVRVRRGQKILAGSIALSALAVAILLGAAGALLDMRLQWRALAVARHDSPLRIQPALGAERASVLHLGETVRVTMRQGPWALVRVDAERVGWLPEESLVPLTRD